MTSTEPRNINLTTFCAQKDIMAIISASLDLKISLLEIFRSKNIGLTSPYVHVLTRFEVLIFFALKKIRYFGVCEINFDTFFGESGNLPMHLPCRTQKIPATPPATLVEPPGK